MIRNDTDKTWEIFGMKDPYYGVLTHDKYRSENLDDSIKIDFFKSGETHVQHVFHVLEKFFSVTSGRRCLDFGCGVGRVTIPLAKRFAHVVGVDVSMAMLSEARENFLHNGVENVTLVKSDDQLSCVQGQFDFIHSYIVLQHIPAKRGLNIVENLLARLNPGGVIALHVPTRRQSSRFRKSVSWARKQFFVLSIIINLLEGKKWNEPAMQMNVYNVNLIFDGFLAHGIRKFYMEIDDSHGGGYIHAFIFAKKPLLL